MTEFAALSKQVSNWGRWGPDDELGTLNLVDAAAVRRGVAAVQDGRSLSLAMPLDDKGPQMGFIPGRINPLRTMIALNQPFSDDVVTMGLQAGTHWDALAHVSHDGTLYNGHPASAITIAGASRCGIDKVATIVSRGVLLDLPGSKGVDKLEPGYAVTAADLDAAAEQAGVNVEAGDVVLVRTGQIQNFHAGDRLAYAYPSAGLSLSTAEWFHAHDVAAVATDNLTCEVYPSEIDEPYLPVHLLHLVYMGLTQGQNFDLEALAADCAADGRYTFLLDASPQPFTGGLGSPVNPVVTK
jgi:kynurenine formamidase